MGDVCFLLALSNVRNVAIEGSRLDRTPHCHSRTDRSHSRDTAKTFHFLHLLQGQSPSFTDPGTAGKI